MTEWTRTLGVGVMQTAPDMAVTNSVFLLMQQTLLLICCL
jgi:hypothetical protein